MGTDTLMLWEACKLLGAFVFICGVVICAANLWLWFEEKFGEDE